MNRRNLLLSVLAAFVVAAVWWVFFISPRNSDISDIEGQTQAAQDQELGLRAQLSQLQAIVDSELTYRAALGELESSIPENPDIADFIEAVNLLALESGVELTALQPAQPSTVEGADFFEIRVSMALEGQYFEVLGFLFGLSDMERLVRVDSISLNPVSTEEEEVPTEEEVSDASSTSSTTTTTIPQREGQLTVTISSTLFTRTPLLISVTPPEETAAESEEPAEGEEAPTTTAGGE